MKNCPLCGNELDDSDIVCSACVEKIFLNEPGRRANKIRHVADTLLIFLAVLFFLKGAFAMWQEGGYINFVRSLGYPVGSEGLHYFNASICILAALGYAVTVLGNYLSKTWTRRLGLGTLCFFVAGQTIVQLADIHDEYGFTKALSAICFLSVAPILQYVMAVLGRPKAETPAP